MKIKKHILNRPLQTSSDIRLYFELDDLRANMVFAGEDEKTGGPRIYILIPQTQSNGEDVYWGLQEVSPKSMISLALANNPLNIDNMPKILCEFAKLNAMHLINTDALVPGGVRYIGTIGETVTNNFVMGLFELPFERVLSYAEEVINLYIMNGLKVEDVGPYKSVRK